MHHTDYELWIQGGALAVYGGMSRGSAPRWATNEDLQAQRWSRVPHRIYALNVEG